MWICGVHSKCSQKETSLGPCQIFMMEEGFCEISSWFLATTRKKLDVCRSLAGSYISLCEMLFHSLSYCGNNFVIWIIRKQWKCCEKITIFTFVCSTSPPYYKVITKHININIFPFKTKLASFFETNTRRITIIWVKMSRRSLLISIFFFLIQKCVEIRRNFRKWSNPETWEDKRSPSIFQDILRELEFCKTKVCYAKCTACSETFWTNCFLKKRFKKGSHNWVDFSFKSKTGEGIR